MVVSACFETRISGFLAVLAIRAAGNDRKHLQSSEGFDSVYLLRANGRLPPFLQAVACHTNKSGGGVMAGWRRFVMAGARKVSSKRRTVKGLVLIFVFGSSLFTGRVLAGDVVDGKKDCPSSTFRMVARLYMANGSYREARLFAERALSLARTTGACDSELCLCYIDLAYLYKEQGKLADAERMCKIGLRLQEELHGQDHPYVTYTLRILSSIYQGRGKYREARLVLDRAMAIMEKAHLTDGQVLAPLQVDIARLLVSQDRYEEAETYFATALDSINKTYGPDHLYTAAVLGSVAKLYALQGRHSEAEALIARTVALQEKGYGPGHHFLAPAWLTTAGIHRARKDYARAETLLQKALVAVQEKHGPEHPITAEVSHMLGQLHASQGEYATSEDGRRRAVKAPEDPSRVRNNTTSTSFDNSARLYISRDKYAESVNPYRTTNRRLRPGKDEVGSALQKMLKTLEEVAEQASIASGDYSAEIVPRRDDDDVGSALSRLTETLREVDSRRRRQ